jgi:isoleucyl-tRNA synthetase
MSYEQLPYDATYSNHEMIISDRWFDENLYDELIKEVSLSKKEISFCDGPPFPSSNIMHFGTCLVSFIKSTIFYYHTLNKRLMFNRQGIDVHGLSCEAQIQKKHNLNTKKDIEQFGIDKFIDECKSFVSTCYLNWEPTFKSLPRLTNFKNMYSTMSIEYMESIWWAFSELYKKGLVYQACKIQPYSPACFTSFSNFEAGQNYKDIQTRTSYVFFPLIEDETIGFVAWTTTNWTLPMNVALCVNPQAEYVKVFDGNRYYIVSKNHINNLELKQIILVENLGKGINLLGMKYIPLYNLLDISFYQIIVDEFVDCTESNNGTGIVHIAPCFGEDDFNVCLKNGFTHKQIMQLCKINDDGTYNIDEFNGLLVTSSEVDKKIVIYMKTINRLVRNQQITHSYPYCYRTDTPLIYKVVDSIFIKVTEIKQRMIELNKQINWIPEHIKTGRFGKWLENARDWNISRNRIFSTPIPLWISDDKEEIIVISSIDELYHLTGIIVNDLHIDTIDKIQIPSQQGKGMLKRVSFTFDCWFESGCAPIGEIHYPFENKEVKPFSKKFICEGLDQTRGWFYTLHVISTALFDELAFENVICAGLICAADGQKLSKRLGNFTDPTDTFKKYGADYVRLYMLGSPAVKAETLNFNELDVEKTKQRIIPYINAIKFMLEHIIHLESSLYNFDKNAYKYTINMMDKWIISRTGTLLKIINKYIELYKIDSAVHEIINYVDDLTNWYIKFNRDRMKGHLGKDEQIISLSTLNFVLYNYNIILAPFTPLLSEHLHKYLGQLQLNDHRSIFHQNYPNENDFTYNLEVEEQMRLLQKIAGNVRTMRFNEKQFTSAKVPISKIIIEHTNEQIINNIKLILNFIQEEVNCIDIECKQSSNTYVYKIEFNQRNMGNDFKKDNKLIQEKLNGLSQEEIKDFYNKNIYMFNNHIIETNKHVNIQKIPLIDLTNSNIKTCIDGELMISIDFTYNQHILNTHLVRLYITKVQQLRKISKLHPWNSIVVLYDDTLKELLDINKEFIENRLLCKIDNISNRSNYDKPDYVQQVIDLNDNISTNIIIIRLD